MVINWIWHYYMGGCSMYNYITEHLDTRQEALFFCIYLPVLILSGRYAFSATPWQIPECSNANTRLCHNKNGMFLHWTSMHSLILAAYCARFTADRRIGVKMGVKYKPFITSFISCFSDGCVYFNRVHLPTHRPYYRNIDIFL